VTDIRKIKTTDKDLLDKFRQCLHQCPYNPYTLCRIDADFDCTTCLFKNCGDKKVSD